MIIFLHKTILKARFNSCAEARFRCTFSGAISQLKKSKIKIWRSRGLIDWA
jgi:hypothetical protein